MTFTHIDPGTPGNDAHYHCKLALTHTHSLSLSQLKKEREGGREGGKTEEDSA